LQLNWSYSNFLSARDVYFHDVTTGAAGSYKALAGWDFVTGIGTPRGLTGM
jgi:hypothetical protein